MLCVRLAIIVLRLLFSTHTTFCYRFFWLSSSPCPVSSSLSHIFVSYHIFHPSYVFYSIPIVFRTVYGVAVHAIVYNVRASNVFCCCCVDLYCTLRVSAIDSLLLFLSKYNVCMVYYNVEHVIGSCPVKRYAVMSVIS